MTAINIRVADERATVWADGLSYLPDGTVHGIMHKARRLGSWKAVLISTGLAAAGNELAERLPALAGSFDNFRANREALLRLAMGDVQPLIDASTFPRFAAFIVGFSDSEGAPELIVYNDASGLGDGTISTTTEIISPRLSEEEQEQVMVACRDELAKSGRKPSLSFLARSIMEAQRLHRADPDFAADGCYVGGHITETVIDAQGVHEKVIHRWNDVIGEKVNPAADCPQNVSPLTSGNRAERRRAERLAKRGKAA